MLLTHPLKAWITSFSEFGQEQTFDRTNIEPFPDYIRGREPPKSTNVRYPGTIMCQVCTSVVVRATDPHVSLSVSLRDVIHRSGLLSESTRHLRNSRALPYTANYGSSSKASYAAPRQLITDRVVQRLEVLISAQPQTTKTGVPRRSWPDSDEATSSHALILPGNTKKKSNTCFGGWVLRYLVRRTTSEA